MLAVLKATRTAQGSAADCSAASYVHRGCCYVSCSSAELAIPSSTWGHASLSGICVHERCGSGDENLASSMRCAAMLLTFLFLSAKMTVFEEHLKASARLDTALELVSFVLQELSQQLQ